MIRFIPTFIYFLVIWHLSSSKLSIDLGGNDKVVHVFAYSLMGVFLAFGYYFSKDEFKDKWLKILLVGTLLGFVDEAHQLFVPGRSCDIFDLMSDSVGIMTGMAWYIVLLEIIPFLKRLKNSLFKSL